jgi:perosamine synthetase
MYPRHRIDISAREFARAVRIASCRSSLEDANRDIVSRYDGDTLTTLSVRSAFDLLLSSLGLQPGDEIIMSALTIADMGRIVAAHGLSVVPVDVDPHTLAPDMRHLEQVLSRRSRMIVVAHLFGGRANLEQVAAVARARGLLLAEDCAQALRGAEDCGSPLADISMFSFGTLKTATAFGGAITHVRRPGLAQRMSELEAAWPHRDARWYRARLARYAGILPLQQHHTYGMVMRVLALRGQDVHRQINRVTRGFSNGPSQLISAIRHRPPGELVRVLADRLDNFPEERLMLRREYGERIRDALPEGVCLLGAGQQEHSHWMLPVLAPDNAATIASLRSHGCDATRASDTNMVALQPAAAVYTAAVQAADAAARAVFIPGYPELGVRGVAKVIAGLHSACRVPHAASGSAAGVMGKDVSDVQPHENSAGHARARRGWGRRILVARTPSR